MDTAFLLAGDGRTVRQTVIGPNEQPPAVAPGFVRRAIAEVKDDHGRLAAYEFTDVEIV